MKKLLIVILDEEIHSLDLDNQVYDILKLYTLAQSELLITFQTGDLLRKFSTSSFNNIPNIIDLESYCKQRNNLLFHTKNSSWNLMKNLVDHNFINDEFELKDSTIKTFLERIRNFYLFFKNSDQIEEDRFQEVEQKINKIIYERQLKGIPFSKEIVTRKNRELEMKEYQIKNILQLDHSIFQPLNKDFQNEYLKSKNYKLVKSLRYSFKIRKTDKVAQLIYELIRTRDDSKVFSLLSSTHWGSGVKTYPSFQGFGSITSRITLRQPAIQNLKKTNRDVFVAEPNKTLLYIDYSQFEAGILASLSNDVKLIELYNTADIYEDIAINVLGDIKKRAASKILFYRYMYGDTTLDSKTRSYFEQFEQLSTFKNDTKIELDTNGKVGTNFGNYRYISDSETDWSLSHKIQATASLIFKNALISVYDSVKSAEFLIPLHDAALYQINDIDFLKAQKKIIWIFKREFVKICPKIKAKVNIGNFAE